MEDLLTIKIDNLCSLNYKVFLAIVGMDYQMDDHHIQVERLNLAMKDGQMI